MDRHCAGQPVTGLSMQAAFVDADSTATALQSAAPQPVVAYSIAKLQL